MGDLEDYVGFWIFSFALPPRNGRFFWFSLSQMYEAGS